MLYDRVTENIIQAGMEKILAESLLEISRKTHEECGIKTYHVPYHPRRIYIESPGILEIQQFMKFSAYGSLVSRATRIFDDINRDFLHGTSIPDVPCPGSWVRIIPAGIYKGDLALVVITPSEGDVVNIVVVPRLDVSQNKKRKYNGLFARAASAPALLDPEFLAKFPPNENFIHLIGSRAFHRTGLEILKAPAAHVLKIEPRPTEAELFLFRSCLARLDKSYISDDLIWRAVNEAFRNESRWLWHTGDRVRILGGAFVDTSCSIYEIDEANRTAIVEFGSPNLTRVEVSMEDLEREFLVGDQVRVALGKNKGRTGSIIEITDNVGTIVEGMANQPTEVTPPSILLHLLIIIPAPSAIAVS
jgi:ribosomal protein L24